MQVGGAMVPSSPLAEEYKPQAVPSPGSDRGRRGSSIQDHNDDIVKLEMTSGKNSKARAVDTSALTGLRGLAALQVATGHIAPLTNLWGGGTDLIGGAAMPFFFLLSGYIMTLGYGQTKYAIPGCCSRRREGSGAELDADSAAKPMAKGRFWQNRFARLWPVYAVTNAWVIPRIFEMHSMGGGMGVLGITANLIFATLGMNSWVVPLIDAGMPPNAVCWTITTMSFFYWCFPYLLPRWQRMSVESRNAWIVNCFWIQCVGYFLPFWLYARIIPQGTFYRPGAGGRPDGAWWSGVTFEVRNQGAWIGRAWPGTRIFVFAMGCLSALNRLDAHRASKSNDPEAVAAKDTSDEAGVAKAPADDRGQIVIGGRGGFDFDCSCRLGPRSRDPPKVWARRADMLVLIYVVFIVIQVLIANLHNPMHVILMEAGLTYFGMPMQGRAVAEALVPMLELGIIVALSYSGPTLSWSARFCNSAPIRWLGNISMSFYMSHMIILQEFNALGKNHWTQTPLDPPSNTCPQMDLQLCMSGQFPGQGPRPDPDPAEQWPSPQAYCQACQNAWMSVGMNPAPSTLHWWMIPVLLLLCMLVGWLLTRYLELPAQAILRRDWPWKPFHIGHAGLRKCCCDLEGVMVPGFLPVELAAVFAVCRRLCYERNHAARDRRRSSFMDASQLLSD